MSFPVEVLDDVEDVVFYVKGLHCPACEILVGDVLSEDDAVVSVSVKRHQRLLRAKVRSPLVSEKLIDRWNRALGPMGYKVFESEGALKNELRREIGIGIGGGLLFLAGFAALQATGVLNLFSPERLEFQGSFLLGLIASVSSCFALVGGLLVTFTAAVGQRDPRQMGPALTGFHFARVLTFALLGGLLGLLGKTLAFDQSVFVALYAGASATMIVLGLKLIGVWKGWGFLARKVASSEGKLVDTGSLTKKIASAGTVGGGLILGGLTFFLPCGFTQTVQFQALASGSFTDGMLLMGAFVIGTLPALLLVSLALKKGLSGPRKNILLVGSGVVVVGLGLYQLQNVFVLLGWWRPLFS